MANERRGLLSPEDLRPTLIIGLGGTGKMILTRLRAYFETYFGDVPRQRIRLLELDIDTAEEVARLDDREVRLREDEKIDLGEVPARGIIDQVRKNKLSPLQGWLHRQIRLMEMSLRRGGQQIRQLGRLAFLWHAEGIVESQHLREKLTKVLDGLTSQYTVSADQPLALQVFVISSLCGGTGGGMFIDFAYLLQDILRGRALLDKTQMIAFLTTPLFFSSAPQENLRPNTWAALLELDYFTRTEEQDRRLPPRLTYFADRAVPTQERPYQIVYLIDAVDHLGRNIAHPEYMARLVRAATFTLSASRIADEAASRINNVRAVRDTRTGTVYSTLGFASYVVPIDEIVGIAAARLLQEVLPEMVRAPGTDAARQAMEREVDRVLEDQREALVIDVEVLARRLNPGATRGLRAEAQVQRGHLAQVDSSGLYQEVKRRLERADPDLEERITEHVREQRAQVRTTFESTLSQVLGELFVTEGRGFPFAQRFLERIKADLERGYTDVGRQLDTAQAAASGSEQSVGVADGAFRDAQQRAGSLLGRLRGNLPRAAEDYVTTYQTWLEHREESAAYEALRRLLAGMLEWIDNRLREMEGFKTNLDDVLGVRLPGYIEETKGRMAEMDPVRERPILEDEADFKPRYRGPENRYWQQARQSLETAASRGDLLKWLEMHDSEALVQMLIRAARQAWAHLYQAPELYVEAIIRSGSEEPASYLKALDRNAAYFWQTLVSEAVARDEMREITTVIGVADPARTVFADYLSDLGREVGNSVIATGDPYRITVLKMAHGITFDTLAQRNLYLQDYRRAVERQQPVHVFPDFYLGDELDKGLERRRTVALAWAYQLLRARADVFTLLKQEGEEPEIVTRQGLFDLLWNVVRDDSRYEQLKELVEQFELAQSKEELLERLSQFSPTIPEERQLHEEWLKDIMVAEVAKHRAYVQKHYES